VKIEAVLIAPVQATEKITNILYRSNDDKHRL
jgi:hypothetical protein